MHRVDDRTVIWERCPFQRVLVGDRIVRCSYPPDGCIEVPKGFLCDGGSYLASDPTEARSLVSDHHTMRLLHGPQDRFLIERV